jgi:hypothetical protein
MLITDQVAIAPCTDCVQARRPTFEAKPLTIFRNAVILAGQFCKPPEKTAKAGRRIDN